MILIHTSLKMAVKEYETIYFKLAQQTSTAFYIDLQHISQGFHPHYIKFLYLSLLFRIYRYPDINQQIIEVLLPFLDPQIQTIQ